MVSLVWISCSCFAYSLCKRKCMSCLGPGVFEARNSFLVVLHSICWSWNVLVYYEPDRIVFVVESYLEITSLYFMNNSLVSGFSHTSSYELRFFFNFIHHLSTWYPFSIFYTVNFLVWVLLSLLWKSPLWLLISLFLYSVNCIDIRIRSPLLCCLSPWYI